VYYKNVAAMYRIYNTWQHTERTRSVLQVEQPSKQRNPSSTGRAGHSGRHPASSSKQSVTIPHPKDC